MNELIRVTSISLFRLPVTCLIAGLAVGCFSSDSGNGGQGGNNVGDRDSLGIAIVENGDLTAARRCLVTLPIVSIGALHGEPEYELFRVGGAALMPDGRIAVANGGTAEVRIYDRTGHFLRSLGRRGDGPGEFRFLGNLWATAGDTLIAHTWHPIRFSIFGPDGSFVKTVQTVPAYSAPQYAAVLADGTFILASRCCALGRSGQHEPQQLSVVRHAADGSLIDTVASFAYGTLGQVGSSRDRLGAQPLFQPLPRLSARDSIVVVSAGERPEVIVMNLAGETVRVIRWSAESPHVTDDHVKRHRDELLADARTALDSHSARLLTGPTRPVRDRFPITANAHLSAEGSVWVELYRLPGATEARWLLFDSHGRARCWFTLPPRYEILDITHDAFLGVRTDEFGAEYVELRRLTQ